MTDILNHNKKTFHNTRKIGITKTVLFKGRKLSRSLAGFKCLSFTSFQTKSKENGQPSLPTIFLLENLYMFALNTYEQMIKDTI